MAFDFAGGYNRNNFINFLRTDLFRNKFTQQLIPVKPERKTAFFVENGIYQLGTIQLGEEEISVFEIKQSSKNDPRVTLTQDTFKLMGDLGIDNAIVALYVDDKSSWRFSLLTTKYEDFKKTTSNPKRFSFILGPNEKIRTVNQQLIKKGEIKDFEDLVSRFDVEVVRQEFFETYLELFVRLYKEILKDKPFADLLSSQNVDLVSFTKNLLGKIIFLYFVQQKGWLGLGKNTTTKYGEGNKNFMRKLWLNFREQGESLCTHEKTGYFYNDYLEWLFFAGLNVDRRKNDDRFEQLQMKVPYLNGGLFREEYEGWKTNISRISNDIFSNKNEDGILDIFDRYNFTIDEDSLYDTDIAVDPEMLGRIFEKMISISSDNIKDVLENYNNKKANAKFDFGKDLNKKLGAFYTPREIVHYMTRESLITYIQNKTNISEENIKILFDLKEKFLLNSTDMKKAEYSTEKLIEIGNSIIDIDEALKSVKILDPAVGSGAFPMGLLHEISSLRYYMYKVFDKILKDKLENYLDNNRDISLYKIKKDIILNNIHGVDIDPGAIDIAKLRFRLSLVVDEQEPEPLPNFEFKFISADSLIPLEEGSLFTKADVIDKLKDLRDEYYRCDDKDEKEKLKNKFYDIKRELTGFGKSRLDFKSKKEWDEYLIQSYNANSDLRNRQILEWDPFETKEYTKRSDTGLMMGQDKFDIVIGNPPYIDSESMSKNEGGEYRERVATHYSFTKGNWDIYIAFFEKGFISLNDNGILSYITPDKWTGKDFGNELRKGLLKNFVSITMAGRKVFENAKVDSIISFISKKDQDRITILKYEGKNNFYKLRDFDKNEITSPYYFDYLFSSGLKIIKKVDNNDNVLSNLAICENACATSDAYLLEPIVQNGDHNDDNYKLINTGTIGKYVDRRGQKEITYLGKKIICPICKKQDFHTQFPNSYGTKPSKIKLIGKGLNLLDVCIDEVGDTIPGKSTRMITSDDNKNLYFLLALLNTKLAFYYIKEKYSASSYNGGTTFTKDMINNLPIPNNYIDVFDDLIDIVNKILSFKKEDLESDTSDLENQINQKVYHLYGLTDEEIQIVEDSIK